jgi:hypothetical protein
MVSASRVGASRGMRCAARPRHQADLHLGAAELDFRIVGDDAAMIASNHRASRKRYVSDSRNTE